MTRLGLWLFGAILAAGLVLKLDRYATQPIASQQDAGAALAGRLQAAGWTHQGTERLLADGSFAAERFAAGPCRLELALLPPGPEYRAVIREAWGEGVRFLDPQTLGPEAPERPFQPLRHLAARLGLGPAPAPFGLAMRLEGPCAPLAIHVGTRPAAAPLVGGIPGG